MTTRIPSSSSPPPTSVGGALRAHVGDPSGAGSAGERSEVDAGLSAGHVARAQRGEPGALEGLLVAAQPRLLAVCLRFTNDVHLARDLCQDALVRIIRGLPEFQARSKPSTWMIRIAMNVCLTQRRREKLRGRVVAESGRDAGAGGEKASLEPGPGSRVEGTEERERLAAALARLAPESRAILILRDAQGLDYADIAEVLEVPVGTVKSRIFRARTALREEMERPGGRIV
ncbi:MAG: RNA polymerase sigma factor [Planctomycetota bacterium]|nr:RNA polymerase sigma factor [Planctomycetota bacterium]